MMLFLWTPCAVTFPLFWVGNASAFAMKFKVFNIHSHARDVTLLGEVQGYFRLIIYLILKSLDRQLIRIKRPWVNEEPKSSACIFILPKVYFPFGRIFSTASNEYEHALLRCSLKS